jgi:hypothetical protein
MINQMVSQRETSDGPPVEIIPGDEMTLSDSEMAALDYYEKVIEGGLRAFLEAGAALLVINRKRLYRASHSDFYSYCEQRWGIQKSQAYRLMDACEVVDNLSPIGDTLPANEAQARPLARLKDPEQQRQAWQTALQRAKEAGKRITAAIVEAVVREVQPLEPSVEPPQKGPSAAHSEAEDTEPEPTLDSTPETSQNPAQWLTDNTTVDDDDDALDDEEEAERRGEWPDDLQDLQDTMHRRGYMLIKETEARLTYQRDSDQAVVTVAKPPEPGKLKVRVVAHRDDDWNDVADHLALAGVQLDSPRAGHLPKYPETQRGYGVLDLNTDQLDQVASLQAELAKAKQQIEQWKQRHETQCQALEAMRGRAIQADTQLEVEQHKVEQARELLQKSKQQRQDMFTSADETKKSPLEANVRSLLDQIDKAARLLGE